MSIAEQFALPQGWSKDRLEKFRADYADRSIPVTAIGEDLGISAARVSLLAHSFGWKRREPYKKRPYMGRAKRGGFSDHHHQYLSEEASRRGISIRELLGRVQHALLDGKLITAVLDDE